MFGDCVSDMSSDKEDGDQIYDDIRYDADVANVDKEEKEPEKEEDNAARELSMAMSMLTWVVSLLKITFGTHLEKENLEFRYERLNDRNKN